ncbi:MAG: PEP-CTERM sorting domain-containing protein [Bryobacterales bacterium]|nr:PEP-CTERM sorting domain-containing protein [Bryobacterales bacterium]
MRSAFLAILLGAVPAMAGLISNPTAGVFDGSLSNSGVSNQFSGPAGEATLTATACFGGFCPGQGQAGPGPDYSVSDPLNVRLTGVDLRCLDTNGCNGVFVQANFSFYATRSTQYAAHVGIDGFAPPKSELLYGGLLLNWTTLTGVSGNRTLVTQSPINGTVNPRSNVVINDSFSLGTLDVNAGDQVVANLNLIVPFLAAGRGISLPDSLTMTLVDTNVPEPATLGLMVLGLAALVVGRKRL